MAQPQPQCIRRSSDRSIIIDTRPKRVRMALTSCKPRCFCALFQSFIRFLVATLLVISSFAVFTTIIGILLYAITRTARSVSSYARDLQAYEEHRSETRSLFTFSYNLTERREHQIPVSESMITIQISPSSPAIFGDEKNEERAVKVFLTPPTPAKKDRMSLASRGGLEGMDTVEF
jgi:hypothetical protein